MSNANSNREMIVELVFEEMLERDWRLSDISHRMGGTSWQERNKDNAALHMYLVVANDCILGEEMCRKLSKAFGMSPEFFVNLENSQPTLSEGEAIRREPINRRPGTP